MSKLKYVIKYTNNNLFEYKLHELFYVDNYKDIVEIAISLYNNVLLFDISSIKILVGFDNNLVEINSGIENKLSKLLRKNTKMYFIILHLLSDLFAKIFCLNNSKLYSVTFINNANFKTSKITDLKLFTMREVAKFNMHNNLLGNYCTYEKKTLYICGNNCCIYKQNICDNERLCNVMNL
jgi:hypothetical protein